MKIELTLLLIIRAACFSFANDENGEQENLPSACQDIGPECLDSNTLISCAQTSVGTYEEKIRTNCAESNKNMCCNNKTKSCSRECGSPGNFVCVQEGYFPDIKDCHKFFICNKKNNNPAIGDCNGILIYDADKIACVLESKDSGSNKATTKGKPMVYEGDLVTEETTTGCKAALPNFDCTGLPPPTAIPKNKQYFAYCISPDGIYTIQKCPLSYQFVDKEARCEFLCENPGLFADATDKTKYFVCTSVNGQPLEMRCNLGETFDSTLMTCVSISPKMEH